jgi:hypothetical protein
MSRVQPLIGALTLVCGLIGVSLEHKRSQLESECTVGSHMPAIWTSAVASTPNNDDITSICAISIVAGILTNVLHEGVGHGLIALLTGASSGVLTTVAWSSAFDQAGRGGRNIGESRGCAGFLARFVQR